MADTAVLTPELHFLERYIQLLRSRLAIHQQTILDEQPPLGDELVERALAELDPSVRDTLPIIELAETLGLDMCDLDLLMFGAAFRLDPSLGLVAAVIQTQAGRDWPTPDLWLRLRSLDEPASFLRDQSRLSTERALFRSGLVELCERSGTSGGRLTAELVVPHDVLALLSGHRTLSADLGLVAERISPLAAAPTPLVAPSLRKRLRSLLGGHLTEGALGKPSVTTHGEVRGNVFALTGPQGAGRSALARAEAHRLGLPIIRFDGHVASTAEPFRLQRAVTNAVREASLHRELLLIEAADRFFAEDRPAGAWFRRAVARHRALVVLIVEDLESLARPVRQLVVGRVDVTTPQEERSASFWEDVLDELAVEGADPASLAYRFPLDGRQIVHAARQARLVALGSDRGVTADAVVVSPDLVADCASDAVRDDLGRLGVATSTNESLDQLIVPDDQRAQLEEIVDAWDNRHRLYVEWGFAARVARGRGLICLFDGEPGTGKTMAAGALANELQLRAIRISTSQVIDKYIGETEKQLAAIFDRARPQLHLLLFDEADSLFAKRTKVERSTDRYGNSAINVLLQLVEHYEGLVVLTTNLKSGIDPAFERRFSYRITFASPDADQRAAIWRTFVPDQTPLAGDVDFDQLAKKFELTGGGIKTAVIRAGYLALRHNEPLSMKHLTDACYRELASSGKLVRS